MAKHNDITRLTQAIRNATTPPEEEDLTTWITDHIAIERIDNRAGNHTDLPRAQMIKIHVDDYRPEQPENWAVEEWEARTGTLFVVATKAEWRSAYCTARILTQYGICMFAHSGLVVELPCEVIFDRDCVDEEAVGNSDKKIDSKLAITPESLQLARERQLDTEFLLGLCEFNASPRGYTFEEQGVTKRCNPFDTVTPSTLLK